MRDTVVHLVDSGDRSNCYHLTTGCLAGRALPSPQPAGADRTLILAVKSGCVYCERSMPLYRDVIRQRTDQGVRLRIVAAAPNQDTACADYLKAQNLRTDALVFFDLTQFKISGTPTLLLVDEGGHVIAAWQGRLPPYREEELWWLLFGAPRYTRDKRES